MTPSDVYLAYIAAENARDRVGMERCLASDLAVTLNGVSLLADRDADAEATDRLLARYPGYERAVDSVFETGATVVAEWRMTGAADPGRGIPELSVAGCTIAEIEGDVIARARLYTDPAAIDRILDAASVGDS